MSYEHRRRRSVVLICHAEPPAQMARPFKFVEQRHCVIVERYDTTPIGIGEVFVMSRAVPSSAFSRNDFSSWAHECPIQSIILVSKHFEGFGTFLRFRLEHFRETRCIHKPDTGFDLEGTCAAHHDETFHTSFAGSFY